MDLKDITEMIGAAAYIVISLLCIFLLTKYEFIIKSFLGEEILERSFVIPLAKCSRLN